MRVYLKLRPKSEKAGESFVQSAARLYSVKNYTPPSASPVLVQNGIQTMYIFVLWFMVFFFRRCSWPGNAEVYRASCATTRRSWNWRSRLNWFCRSDKFTKPDPSRLVHGRMQVYRQGCSGAPVGDHGVCIFAVNCAKVKEKKEE